MEWMGILERERKKKERKMQRFIYKKTATSNKIEIATVARRRDMR